MNMKNKKYNKHQVIIIFISIVTFLSCIASISCMISKYYIIGPWTNLMLIVALAGLTITGIVSLIELRKIGDKHEIH